MVAEPERDQLQSSTAIDDRIRILCLRAEREIAGDILITRCGGGDLATRTAGLVQPTRDQLATVGRRDTDEGVIGSETHTADG